MIGRKRREGKLNRTAIKENANYVLDGQAMLGLIKVMDRLYDDSKPFAVNERRDLAQRLHVLLEKSVEL